jgi:hypothetical protein
LTHWTVTASFGKSSPGNSKQRLERLRAQQEFTGHTFAGFRIARLRPSRH